MPLKNSFPVANSLDHIRSASISANRLLPGIHGLRGIAALSVVLFHIVHVGKVAVPDPFSFIANYFGNGVQLFFVISAFSLLYSTERTINRPNWMVEYFVKRFFRIAPLYYFVMIGTIVGSAIKWKMMTVNLQTLVLNLTFTFGLAPWTSIVMAGWTVGVEMLFYAVFPVLLLTVRTTRATFSLLIISIIVTYSARVILTIHYESQVSQYRYNWAGFSFASNLCYFVMGMVAFRLSALVDRNSFLVRWLMPSASIILLSALIIGPSGEVLWNWRDETILWGIGFTCLCIWQSKRPSSWAANRIFQYLGERSYSIYLLHPIVIVILINPLQALYVLLAPYMGSYAYFACVLFVMLPLLLLSEMAYKFVENPGIKMGQKINRKADAVGNQKIIRN